MWTIASAIDTNYAHRCDAVNAQSHLLDESVKSAEKAQLSEDLVHAEIGSGDDMVTIYK